MTSGIFVTGTDTGVGKTVAATALLRAFVAAGRRAVGMKPVAAGVDAATGVNGDVHALAEAGNVTVPLRDRNPYAFQAPIAPHIAARDEGRRIEIAVIEAAYARLALAADAVVVEGAGGVLVPLDDSRDMLDVALALRLPVLLVVGIRLGCLNHALLSALAIRERGLVLAGWIAARLDPAMLACEANVDALERRLAAPRLGDFATPRDASLGATALAACGYRAVLHAPPRSVIARSDIDG